jgi:hypothetical protein
MKGQSTHSGVRGLWEVIVRCVAPAKVCTHFLCKDARAAHWSVNEILDKQMDYRFTGQRVHKYALQFGYNEVRSQLD